MPLRAAACVIGVARGFGRAGLALGIPHASIASPLGATIHGCSVDLSDSVYQFKFEPLAAELGVDYPEEVGVYGATSVWTPSGWEAVSSSSRRSADC